MTTATMTYMSTVASFQCFHSVKLVLLEAICNKNVMFIINGKGFRTSLDFKNKKIYI